MNLFEIIASSLAPTTKTAKGSIVTIAKNDTKVYETTLSGSRVIATYNSGKILGTLQELKKMTVVRNGTITTEIFFMAKVKFSEFIPSSVFDNNIGYYEGWVLAESLDVYGDAISTTTPTSTVSNESAIYSTGVGVNIRSTAAIVGQVKDKVNNIITVFNQGDLIGYSSREVSNGFYKVRFVTPQTKKSDGKKYEYGYVSISFSSVVEPQKSPTSSNTSQNSKTPSKQQKEASKVVTEDRKYSQIDDADTGSEKKIFQKYSGIIIGVSLACLAGVVIYAINKLRKPKTDGNFTSTTANK